MTSCCDLTAWELVADDGTTWPVTVPGTVTQVVQALDADERTWVFRTVLTEVPDGPVDLVVEGVATSYEVLLDGVLLLTERSMHARHLLPVEARAGSVLEIRCLPLRTALPEGAPRARWRSALADNALRLIRTTLLGRCPGIAPGPPVVGPYRAVRLQTRAPRPRFTTTLDGSTGVVTCSDPGPAFTVCGITGTGTVRVPGVALWWPHTHGEPVLHDVVVAGAVAARVGFRTVEQQEPFGLVVNGAEIWARGAVWTPPGLLAGRPEDPLATVTAARDAGMNLLRVPGLAPYEDERFFEVCDALGVLVWHDLALANLDVPHDLLDLDGEVAALLDRTAGHPSLAVVCGGSETAQQVTMLGLDPLLWRSDFLDTRAPAAVEGRAVWVPNSPYGDPLATRSSGVSHWFGVGGYRLALSEARARPPRFAGECLAFSHGDGAWVPRDNGSPWDFADVTAHYTDQGWSVGELMAAVLGDWRRPASPNRGAIVLWLRDLQPGAGWGLLAHDGTPKPALTQVAQVLAPQAVWLTDEVLDGVAVHLANDRADVWTAALTVSLHDAGGQLLESVRHTVVVPARDAVSLDVEAVLGRWTDVSWAYRFGDQRVAEVRAGAGDQTGVLRLTREQSVPRDGRGEGRTIRT